MFVVTLLRGAFVKLMKVNFDNVPETSLIIRVKCSLSQCYKARSKSYLKQNLKIFPKLIW